MNFGQFRRVQLAIDNYLTKQSIELKDSVDTIIMNTSFKDTAYGCNLSYDKSYVLRFTIKALSSDISFNVKLINYENKDIFQNIVTLNQNANISKSYEIIITPNTSYDRIVFEINRTETDFKNGARKLTFQSIELYSITNLIGSVIKTDNKPLKHIGVQGPKSLLMCINGEEIRIGHSGFYEIDNKIDINFFGVVVKEDSNKKPLTGGDIYQDFILDYEY
jgi:hypothetical protein